MGRLRTLDLTYDCGLPGSELRASSKLTVSGLSGGVSGMSPLASLHWDTYDTKIPVSTTFN